jgi:pimeloyl-ACP methyl ester carboxylesterase
VAGRRVDQPRVTRWDHPSPTAPSAHPVMPAGNAGRVIRFRSQDGLNLAARIFDAEPSHRLPLLCLPGLSRNSRDFIRLGQFFSRHPTEPRRVVALDYRGRGASDADPNWQNYTPLVEAQDVLAAAAALGLERAVIVGTSRGGIIAMLLGALRPGLIAGVVLNDIGPVVEGTGLARIKKYLSAKRSLPSWDDAIAAVRDIGGTHFPALSEEDWRSSAEAAFVVTPNGLVPDFDPNLLRTLEGIDFSEKIPVLWPQYASLSRVPVLAIRGEFSDLLSPRTLSTMAERHPRFEQMTVRGQGHAPLLRDAPSLERIFAFAKGCEMPAPA